MPASTRGRIKDQDAFVKVTAQLAYGWRSYDISSGTGVTAADVTALGHLTLEGAASLIKVTGANSPKPARFSKKIPNASVTSRGSVSSWCGVDSYATAAAAGWKMVKPSRAPKLVRGEGRRLTTVLATLSNGLKCLCYVEPTAMGGSQNADATLEALGLERPGSNISATDLQKIVYGARSKPGRVVGPASSNVDVLVTMPFSTAKENDILGQGTGYANLSIASRERVEYPAPAPSGGS